MSERERLLEARLGTVPWRKWGPYLSERAWGTVREDYSADGTAWEYFPHDHARSRAYRWSEDGIAGICDDQQYLCFALAFWNGRDPIIKERLFGLTGNEGNHGEDCKELYYYLDCTPSHAYMKLRYLYPTHAFPYDRLVAENRRRGRARPEFELTDTGVLERGYFEIDVTYAKAAPEDIVARIEVTNRGTEPAELHLLPTLWFRNTWSFHRRAHKPSILRDGDAHVRAERERLGTYWAAFDGSPELLFCENESNTERLWGVPNGTPTPKDAINDGVVGRDTSGLRSGHGTRVAAHYALHLLPGERTEIRARLASVRHGAPFADVADVLHRRQEEADRFYADLAGESTIPEVNEIQRQAFAGLLWSKQFYHYTVDRWLRGDPGHPPPPAGRERGRNSAWMHLNAADILSMPDKWEYPWFASWDLAFHCIPLALVDPDFAKDQLVIIVREWYMHPNGQVPAYEWAFGDVNPPVHAWAAWRVYKIDEKRSGVADRAFLERVFHKLLLNFTWWVNRKDAEGNNVFEGGFLGLDNIGVFDRSAQLPGGGTIEQADATSWMAMYCLNMLRIALELARENHTYEDVATKFFEHFLYIARAINEFSSDGAGLWDEEDGFYYDVLKRPDGRTVPMKLRTMVGLTPLFAVETLEPELLAALPGFKERWDWFIRNRPSLAGNVLTLDHGVAGRVLLSIVPTDRLVRILSRMLDEREFLSPYGIRALSRAHLAEPFRLELDGQEFTVRYEPAESSTGLFGGNSNWRGPVWYPVNFLLMESLQKFNHFYGNDLKVPCPLGSGRDLPLWAVAKDLSVRLIRLFLRDVDGRRPVNGHDRGGFLDRQEGVLFYEYFDGDTGRGIGASHQTGWTALVAKLIDQSGDLIEGESRTR
ncbi:MAG: glucosidase [Chloroflexota bacterium]